MKRLQSLCWCVAALSIAIFFGSATWLAFQLKAGAVDPVVAAMHGTHKNGDDGYIVLAQRFLQQSNGAMAAVRDTAQDANRIAKSQEQPSKQLSATSISTVQSVGRLVDSGNGVVVKLGTAADGLNATISQINSGTLPRVNTGLDSLNGVVVGFLPVENSVTRLVESGNAVMIGLKGTVGTANSLLADPDLTAVARNLAVATASGASAMKHIDTATGYIEFDLSPKHVPFWRGLASEALSQAIGIPLKLYPTRVAVTSSVPIKSQ